MYYLTVDSFPSGLCNTCERSLFNCQKAEKLEAPIRPWVREAWAGFKLEDIRVPRTSAVCSQCNCLMCRCAHFNAVGNTGSRKITTKPVVNPTGEPMECQVQPPVMDKGIRGRRGHPAHKPSICLSACGRTARSGSQRKE